MPAWRQGNFLLCEGFNLVADHVNTSDDGLVSEHLNHYSVSRCTFHPMRSAPGHHPYTRRPAIDARDSVYWSSSLFLAYPGRFGSSVIPHATSERTHRNDDMWTVSVAGDDFKAVDRVGIPHNVIQDHWPILLDPDSGCVSIQCGF